MTEADGWLVALPPALAIGLTAVSLALIPFIVAVRAMYAAVGASGS